jgi:LmbE family N-acetylglucosaminyl deacetylase
MMKLWCQVYYCGFYVNQDGELLIFQSHLAATKRVTERLNELKNCCKYLGFEVFEAMPNGFEKVNCSTRNQFPNVWTEMVQRISEILAIHKPQVIFLPHNNDWNSTHVGTHFLVTDALKKMPLGFTLFYC